MPVTSDARPRKMQMEVRLERIKKTVSVVHKYTVEASSVL